MGTCYIDTGGSALNSGSTDQNAANLTGTGDAVVTGSVVQLTIGTDLSGIITSGANQSSINIAQATNANMKIFWITAVNDALDQVTVHAAPTGVTASDWKIGGRLLWTKANYEGAHRPGDVAIFNNSPAADTSPVFTFRNSGDSTSGYPHVKGAAGSRPVLTNSANSSNVIFSNAAAVEYCRVTNLELVESGTSSYGIASAVNGWIVYNVKVSDFELNAFIVGNYSRIIGCEVTGGGGNGVGISSANSMFIHGNYFHDIGGHGIEFGSNSASAFVSKNVMDTCAGRGVYYATAQAAMANNLVLEGNTIYGCGDSGLEGTDAEDNITLINNIFMNNGDAAGEYNVELVSNLDIIGFHAWNIFYDNGAGGNLLGLTANGQVASSEFTTDPLFTNAAGGDFSIGSTSPAKATGFPGQFLGSISLGYLDIGAVQRQEPAGGSTPSLMGAACL